MLAHGGGLAYALVPAIADAHQDVMARLAGSVGDAEGCLQVQGDGFVTDDELRATGVVFFQIGFHRNGKYRT